MKQSLLAVLLCLASVPSFGADDDIRKILADRITAQPDEVGIVVGLIGASGRRIISAGPVNGDTLFEIGSTTKVFTALLLADAVARGEMSLDDPIAKYLPAGVKVPERGGKSITLLHLANHTSSLPRLPANLMPKDAANPYADYTVQQMYDFLSSVELTRDIGSQYEYSNFGAGLLGHILARRFDTDYETLVRKRITEPLKMTSTSISLGEALRARLAPGHDAEGKRVPNWDLPVLAGAGALRSSVNDLLGFIAASSGLVESPLATPFASMLKSRRPAGTDGLDVALGWHVRTKGGREIVWHNGGTGGYRSWFGFDPKSRDGVVVLTNTTAAPGVDDIGLHLLDSSIPLAPTPKQRKVVAVDATVLETYTGRYELAPGFILSVTREGNRLFTQATGQPKFEVFAETPVDFFLKVVDAQITFVAGDAGKAQSLVLHQNGRDMPAKRIEGEIPPPKERKEITLDNAVLDRYAGRYQLAPGFVIAITREGNRLFLQATGQGKVEMFAEGESAFFLKVVDAQVTFEKDGTLVLHQNGQDMPGKRIE